MGNKEDLCVGLEVYVKGNSRSYSHRDGTYPISKVGRKYFYVDIGWGKPLQFRIGHSRNSSHHLYVSEDEYNRKVKSGILRRRLLDALTYSRESFTVEALNDAAYALDLELEEV